MATASQVRGSVVSHTITLASLASSATAGREGTAIDNTTDLAIDAELFGKITTGTTPTVNTSIEIWVYGSGDGTNYSGGASGTNAALTPTASTLMALALVIPVTATSNVTHQFYVGSVAALFGGILPAAWGVFVRNNTGSALNSTAGNHAIQHRTIKYASA